METTAEEKIKSQHNLVAKVSLIFQLIAGIIAILIMIFHPRNCSIIGKSFSMAAFVISIIISRIYIFLGKKLENLKQFSEEEKELKRREYFYKIFSSYPMWILFYFLFSKM